VESGDVLWIARLFGIDSGFASKNSIIEKSHTSKILDFF
jgi:hypothetical protein